MGNLDTKQSTPQLATYLLEAYFDPETEEEAGGQPYYMEFHVRLKKNGQVIRNTRHRIRLDGMFEMAQVALDGHLRQAIGELSTAMKAVRKRNNTNR